MRLSNFCEGLALLAPFFKNPDGFHIGAEHDQFFVYQTDRPLDAETVAKLKALGWFQQDAEQTDGLDEDDPANFQYDPQAGWSAFT